MASFYTPWKYQKTNGFPAFLGVWKQNSGMKRMNKTMQCTS